MKKIALEDALHAAYEFVGPNVLSIKSSVINLYSDIDGYFTKKLGIKIGKEINEEQFQKVKLVFPRLSEMTLRQFNSLTKTFEEVRHVNAHLFISRKIKLDSGVEDYLNSIYIPLFIVTKEHCLTVYGQAYIAMFLCQKYNIWGFATSFFRKWFAEFDGYSGNELSSYQVNFQHLYQEYCGIGKPILSECPLPRKDLNYMNQLFKSNMAEFVLSIEETIYPSKKTHEYSISFKKMMEKAFIYDKDSEAISRLALIRNCWLHGVNLYDKIIYKNQEINFDYKFMFESLTLIKEWMMWSTIDFTRSIGILTNFGNACFCFYALRLVEVTYKLLDERLLTEEKVDSRITNANTAYQYIEESPTDFLELAEKLIEPDEIKFNVKAAKFTDWRPRVTKSGKLNIVKLHSDNGFEIGPFHTSQTDLTLALVDLEEDYQNKVNGNYVRDYFKNEGKKIGNRIIIDEINLKDHEPLMTLNQTLIDHAISQL